MISILIGRNREQRRSLKLLDDAHLTPGARRFIQLDGTIGIGKSSLLAYALAHRTAPTYLVHADRLNAAGPLAGYRVMIETLLGEELETLLTETAPQHLAIRCAEALGTQPVLIAVDDAQWIDPTSEAFLCELMLAPTTAPLTIVMVHRIGYEPAALRSAARSRGAMHEHFTLNALSDDAIAEIVGNLPPEHILEVVRVARGNPLFARAAESGFSRQPSAQRFDEVLQFDAHGQSAVLNAVITDDIEALSPHAKTVLRTMAILGTDSSPDLVQHISQIDTATRRSALTELAAHGLLAPNPHEALHPVVRYSAYQNAPVDWRVHVHRSAAQHLTGEKLKQAKHLGPVAAHLDGTEVELLLEAASIALGSTPQTVLHWLSPMTEAQRTETSELLLARAEILTGQQTAAITRLRQLMTKHPSPEVRIQLANALRIDGELEEARALLSTGEKFSQPDILREVIDVYGLLDGRAPEYLVTALAELPGIENQVSANIYQTMYRLSEGQIPAARAHFAAVPDWVLRATNQQLRKMLHAVACAVWCAYMLDDYARGARMADRGLKLAERFGQADVIANLGAGKAFNKVQLANLPEVEEAAVKAIADAQRYGPAGVEAMARSARLIAAQANADRAVLQERYDELRACELPNFTWWRRAVLTTLTRVSAILGTPEPAPDLLAEPHDAMAPLRHADVALAAAVMGQTDVAASVLDVGIRIARRQQAHGQLAMLRVTRAEMLLHAGQLETAEKLFKKALEVFERLGMALQAGRTKAGLARLEQQCTQQVSALTSLTKREREVAQEIALGLTNQQIAQRLSISRRTVEHHAANIMRKLGASSRHTITALLHREMNL